MLVEGQWHHLVVVLNKAVGKSTSFSLYIDGRHMHTQKIQYISLHPGSNYSSSTNPAFSVCAYIGTPPFWRRYSRLCWKQGVCHLIEEVRMIEIILYDPNDSFKRPKALRLDIRKVEWARLNFIKSNKL